MAIIDTWHAEGRTILAVLHDLALVRHRFPETALIARELIGWGPTATVLTQTNLAAARRMSEAFDHDAIACERAA
jgi:zinc/manganese transport system ATP-binding protein